MCDVLIVNPPSPDGHVYIRDVCRWGRKSREKMIWPQTSLAYLAAMVPDDMTVRIIDAIAEEMKPEEFFAEVEKEKPNFYVTYIAGTTFDIDVQGVTRAKECGAVTVAVGTHVSAVPKDTLESVPELDFVIRHEPEISFREVVDVVRAGGPVSEIRGIAYQRDGEIAVTADRELLKDLDDLPIPHQHLLPLDRYKMPFLGRRYVWVLTNRGCPHSCTYCFEGVIWGKSVRQRSAESICRELEYLAEHDVKNVLFLADLFTADRKKVLALCDLIIERGLKVRWVCNSRVDTIDEEMAARMKQAGCWLIAFGIESGSQRVLDNVNKAAKVENATTAINLCHKLGIKTWGYFIIGLPGENQESAQKTIDLAKSLPLDIALFHVAIPYAGTEFLFQAVANGWLNTTDWADFDMNDSVVVGYEDFSAEEILKATKRAFREFYFRPVQMWRLGKMMLGTGDFAMVWDVCRSFLSWLLSKKEDRLPSSRKSDASAEDAAGDARGAAGLEPPRTDPTTAKPRHKLVKDSARVMTEREGN